MSKKLSDIKNTGFKIPKDYFESVEDAVFNTIKKDTILNKVEDSGFTMPEGYFDTLEDKVLNKLENEKNTKVIAMFSKRNLVYLSGVAAAVIILFSVFINKQGIVEEELDYDIVENYILEQDISSYELAALLTEDELSNINADILDEAFNEESLEDYLLENIEIEDIIEQ